MRPEFALSLDSGRPLGILLPAALLAQSRRRQLLRAERAKQVERRRDAVYAYAHRALCQLLRSVAAKELLLFDTLAHGAEAPPVEVPVRPPSVGKPGRLAVVVDYRPNWLGRCTSPLARRVAKDAQFLKDVEDMLRGSLWAAGYQAHFQTHTVQRFVRLGRGGFYRTVRVQLLVSLVPSTGERQLH